MNSKDWIVMIDKENHEAHKIQLAFNLFSLDLGLADQLLDELYVATMKPLMRGIVFRILISKEENAAKTLRWLLVTKKILSGPWLTLDDFEDVLSSIPSEILDSESPLPAFTELYNIINGKRADGTSSHENVFLTLVDSASQPRIPEFASKLIHTLIRIGHYDGMKKLFKNENYRPFFDENWARHVVVSSLRSPSKLDGLFNGPPAFVNTFIDLTTKNDFEVIMKAQEEEDFTDREQSTLLPLFRKLLVRRPEMSQLMRS